MGYTRFPVSGGLAKYDTSGDLPVIAQEGDAAITIDTGNLWTYTSGAWAQQSSGSTTVTLDAEVQGLGFSLSGQEIQFGNQMTFPAGGTLSAPTIKFDSDTGLFSTGDGNLTMCANGFKRLDINQNTVEILATSQITLTGQTEIAGNADVTGDLDVTGNFSAANYPPTGNNDALAYYDGSGELSSAPGFSISTISGGLSENLTIEPDGDTGGFQVNDNTVSFDPQQNSPNESWNIINNNILLDINDSGFSQGTAGSAVTIINQGFTHQGTGDTGSLSGIQQNFQLGNGTDAIDIAGFGYAFGFGNVAASVNISGQVQGYGFQPQFNASSTLGSSANITAFYDATNAPIAVPGYQSLSLSPVIGSINNNNNFNTLNSAPTITTMTGNAGYIGVNLSPTITTVNTGSTRGLVFTPTVTLNKGNATGLDVTMSNVTNYAGVQASLVVQDITYTFNEYGSFNNNYTMEYVDDTTAGNESFTIAGQDITCHIESGVSTATQVAAAAALNLAFSSAVSVVITGTASDPQITYAQTNFAGGINPGTAQAANFVGDVSINGALSFTGALSIGELDSFATDTITSGLGIYSIDTLITAPSVAASATITGTDLLAINTAMLLTIGDNATVTSSFLGYAALGLPAVLSMGTGSTIDLVEGAVFAVSLDAGATGGSVDRLDLCRSVAIPNGVTTVTELVGYAFDLPFGDPGTTTWGFYSTPTSAHNYFAGDVVVGTSDTPTNSSVGIELNSTTKAILNARMTTTQRDALTAVNGMMIYNTTTDKLQVYAASSWVDLH